MMGESVPTGEMKCYKINHEIVCKGISFLDMERDREVVYTCSPKRDGVCYQRGCNFKGHWIS